MTIDITRRRLLQGTAAAAGLGAIPGMSVIRGAQAAGAPTTLVVIHMDGGNDTLNTIIPYANPEYYRLRGGLAIPKASALPLDAANGMHPALVGIKSLWDRSRVAIVHGIGYPGFDYSHFQSKQILWTADPGKTWRMGWLGRAVDAMVAVNPNVDILTAVKIGNENTRILNGQRFNPVQVHYDAKMFSLGSRNEAQSVAIKQLMSLPPTTTNPIENRLRSNYQTALLAYAKVQTVDNNVASPNYPANNVFAHNLRMAVQLMRTDPDVRIISLSQGDYDFHTKLLTRQQAQLTTLDSAIKAFTDDLDNVGLSGRILIMLISDFGRNVLPNAGLGCDHGAAQAVMLIGPGVKPGIVGAAPPLTNLLTNAQLPMQYDFRSLYTTVLGGWLGTDPKLALGGFTYPALPLLL